MHIDFKNKTILVTGGTRGIGKSLVLHYLQNNGYVILTGTHTDWSGRDLEEYEGRYEYLSVNFASKDSREKFLRKLDQFVKIDICINNAGINRLNTIEDLVDEDIFDMLDVNLVAPVMILRNVLKKMKANHYGRVINISSIFGKASREKRSVYTMTKSGIHGLTVTASIEYAPYNVLVNTVSPGFVLTDLTKKNLSEEDMKKITEMLPIKRLAQPDEISRTILFLTSELNTYLTGQNVFIDGGFLNV